LILVFPTGDGLANVGLGMLLETTPPSNAHLRTLLARLLDADAGLVARTESSAIVGQVIEYALQSGRWAAEAILSALDEGHRRPPLASPRTSTRSRTSCASICGAGRVAH
jgi:flavin-dependent dehydrogenase